MKIFPTIPKYVHDREIPRRFRSAGSRWRDPDRALIDFISWLESDNQPAAPRAEGPAAGEQSTEDRDSLVKSYLNLVDTSENEAHKDRILDALRGVGVESVSVDGQPFDPQKHVAIFREPAPDPSQVGTVASTQRLGFVDRGRVIQPPEVSVYVAADA